MVVYWPITRQRHWLLILQHAEMRIAHLPPPPDMNKRPGPFVQEAPW